MITPASTLACPECGRQETETMPTDACRFFYGCKGRGAGWVLLEHFRRRRGKIGEV